MVFMPLQVVIIIDGDEVLTGPFNFTKAVEENNTENLLIIVRDPGLPASACTTLM
jgi:phosphatidylserine/phosphatidylglycerophosphate/cardiolipin synthase-like enzyme